MTGDTPTNAELRQQIANLTNVVAALANAVTASAAAPQVAAPAPVVAFATSPGVAVVEDLIDSTTKHGASLYKQRTSLLEPFSA